MVERAGQLIDGEWRMGDGEPIESVNPADPTAVVARCPGATEAQAGDAIAAAAEAAPDWGSRAPSDRDALLFEVADLIDERTERLAETMTREEGKPLSESRGEVARTAEMFRYFAGDARRATGDTVPSNDPDTFTYTFREPLGVVSVIAPWNFPVGTPGWKLAPALAAGNAVVFKPSTSTPLTGIRLAETIVDAGIPDGVLNVLVGSGSAIGDELVENESVDGVSFTGSNKVGRHVHSTAAERGIPVQTEMGGKNPIVVMPDAPLDAAVEATVSGAFGGTGQKCTATSRAIVHEAVLEEFTDAVVERTAEIELGPGLEDPDMGPAVDEPQLETDLEYIDIATEEGATLLYGGDRPDRDGYFVEPTVFGGVDPDMTIARHEVFGPILAIIGVPDYDEAIRVANDTIFGLSASIFTSDMRRARAFVHDVAAGVVKINGTTSGSDIQMPFGGMKASSSETHKELGQRAYEFYTHEKAVYRTDPPEQ